MRRQPRSSTIVAGLAAATAVALGVCAHTGASDGIDRVVRRAVRPRKSRPAVAVASVVSNLAVPTVHPLIAVAASLAIFRAKGRPAPAPIIAAIAAIAIDRGARLFVHQRRPPKASMHPRIQRYAYPSGHTAAAAAISLATAIDLGEDRPRGDKALLYAAASLCAAVVGWSRLELDEHWIDDVVGGWAAGVASAIVATSMVNRGRAAPVVLPRLGPRATNRTH